MLAMDHQKRERESIRTFVRNRYFYGKLLDVHHLELEQSYFNGKRWLLNRLVSGSGVVCGLDVQITADHKAIRVMPGVALDYAGREIVVPRASEPVPLPVPPKPQGGKRPDCDDEYAHVVICFRQCDTDLEAVSVDDCGGPLECAASSVQEKYTILVRPGRAPKNSRSQAAREYVDGGLNYCALVRHITKGCPDIPADPCITLADVRLTDGDTPLAAPDVDVCVRPIVFTNKLLYEIIVGLAGEESSRRRD